MNCFCLQEKRKSLEKELLKLLLPEGMLDYFELTSVELKDGEYFLYLEEKNIHPAEYKEDKLISRGFFDQITIQDFPLRGKPCYLKIRRRKWFNETTDRNVSRDWKVVAGGTRMTKEFATFLKSSFWMQNL